MIHALRSLPENPMLLQGRDAVIQADQTLYGGSGVCTIRSTFAGRGLGTACPTVVITGPSAAIAGHSNTWTASASGGSGSYSYRWYENDFDTGVTTPSYIATLYSSLTLRVDVTSGGETVSASYYVEVYDTGGCPAPQITCARVAYETALFGAVPNPARGAAAAVRFALAEPSAVRLVVYDALGREVARLADGPYEAGAHEARLAAGLPPGVYVVRMAAGAYTAARRMTVVR